MPAPDDNEIESLREDVARIIEQQRQTNRRLEKMEAALGIASAASPVHAEIVVPKPEPLAAAVPVADSAAHGKLETQMGLTWVNRVGAVTLVIGVAFFFKYAIDNRWIGETGRVLLGFIAGCLTLAVADHFWRRDQETFAQGICGSGIAVLYLSFYASFAFYHLVPQAVAFLLFSLTTGLAGVLALRYNAAAIAALGMFGGYAAPVLLSTGEDRPWTFFTYLLLLNIGALVISKTRSWRRLDWLAFCSTAYLYLSWYEVHFKAEKQIVATVFAVVFYLIFADLSDRILFMASQFCVMSAMLAIWDHTVAPYILLTLGLSLTGLCIADRRRWPDTALMIFTVFSFSYCVWYLAYSAPPLGPSLWLLTGAFLMFFGWTAWRSLWRRADLTLQDLILVALNGPAYFASAYGLLHRNYNAWLGLFSIGLASLHAALGFALHRAHPEDRSRQNSAALSVAVAIGFLILAAPIQFAGYRITMAWALEAAALAWIGVRTGVPRLVYVAMAVFLLVLVRLQLVDFWIYPSPHSYTPLANARSLTGLIAAICLWLAAYWTKPAWMAVYTYVSGHYVMLWILSLETLDGTARTALTNTVAAQTAWLSILVAAYAVALIVGGVASRTGINRFMGLGLIALVIAKLYLYDVWLLAPIYRVIAFGALGALLLFTSYLYSHHRNDGKSF